MVEEEQLITVNKPLSLIPVGLKEAALDSPSFRATAIHFSDQIDAVEKWLDGYVKAASRLAHEIAVLEGLVGSLLFASNPPNQLSEAVMDHDYTLLAMRRYNEAARDTWTWTVGGLKKTQHAVIDPIKGFLHAELRVFKDARRQLELTQKNYDSILSRYLGQVKSKEASALREDAFQLHETRKLYLKASMDFCVLAPQLRANLDALLIKVFTDQWLEMKDFRETPTTAFAKHGNEMDRIRGWSREMLNGEKVLKRELLVARKKIEESAEFAGRPSRELDDYATSTVAFLGAGRLASSVRTSVESTITPSSKQGWLFLRTVGGKPARTSWIRRWFFVKNGIFGWLVQGARSGGVEESDKIGVLLCSIRPAFQEERRFCFEVKTKDTTITLQAETQIELTEWISAFDTAKQKVLEEPGITSSSASSGNPSSDAAFAVSPAIAPELAVKRADGQIANITEDPSGAFLGVESAGVVHPATRSSFDVSSLRKDKDGESSRDHAARIIQKLDLHRKSNAGSQLSVASSSLSPPPVSTGGGVVSLIAASHTLLPVAPGHYPSPAVIISGDQATTSLAPPTLANPPSHTHLTKTSLMVGMDQGLDLGLADSTGGMPSGLMANQWGSTNYGYLSRLERGEVGQLSERSAAPSRGASNGFADFPSNYPFTLKAHDAQFRMLFPNVPQDEKVVLVFRASWNPDESQDLPGRVFVTERDLFFYSHHLGLVLVSSVSLDTITEVSAKAGPYHDLLYLHLKGRNLRSGSGTVVIKTFLEPLNLLNRRLNFLVSNSSSNDPMALVDLLDNLILMETSQLDSNLGLRSREDLSVAERFDEFHRPRRDNKTKLRVDHRLYGGDAAIYPETIDTIKFRLPKKPVQYTPQHMSKPAMEKVYDISAKALFHVMFGDKSAMSQILYRMRRAQIVKQFPWTRLDLGRFSREFVYQANDLDNISQVQKINIIDRQTIEVANDHLCYVVTDSKTPWHLPHTKDFMLITKIVITHVAKSKCKLAIFTYVHWSKLPRFSMNIIQRHALNDLYLDARDMIELVTDQVQKLGPNCYTKRAIDIFGHIGHETDVAQITSTEPLNPGQRRQALIKRKTLPSLTLEITKSLAASASAIILDSLLSTGRYLYKIWSAHTLLLGVVLVSLSIHVLRSSQGFGIWWQDRNAANFMARIGVSPNSVLSKAIYLSDLQTSITVQSDVEIDSNSLCSNAFQNILGRADWNASTKAIGTIFSEPSTKATVRRLHRMRQRMGTYRHDLLVAMRFVNRIEREILQAEYENWLVDETLKCKHLGAILQSNNTRKTAADLNQVKFNSVKSWLREYCNDCEEQQQLVMVSMK